ncbi:tRNA pseudouridine(13) synthase TruD [Phorcysia thermohydrogeniphila]|uniref:tRNA pseudouridine13 synthase n=1 Tax=Phorcysia thermohydrogeniphila TaxID=936138 RepID=A0A4R1GIE1_9BACT|nr:tRNA pseudouridine(13) synthase TruD [Phorcysia thermohydrogeniphila]TCK04012.1 tRNA pseudouridine13 synthase [Phorcysia thermohydrogeniphila]
MAKIKQKPEDFEVTEVLKEPLKKEGAFLVYKLWKKGLETEEAIRKVANLCRVPVKVISKGGLKDKNAVTVQFIAVPEKFRLKELSFPNLKLTFAGRRNKPLNPSEVAGNFFRITVRGAPFPPEERVNVLKTYGIPNYYGEQRFTPVRGNTFFVEYIAKGDLEGALLYLFKPAGWEGSRSRKGKRAFLKGDYGTAEKFLTGWRKMVANFLRKNPDRLKEAFNLIPPSEIEFQFNVFQSFLFNEWLKELIQSKTCKFVRFRYKLGDMLFPLEKVEIPETLPVFHPEVSVPFYESKLREIGIKREEMKSYSKLFHSFSRRTFVPVKDFKLSKGVDGIRLSFFLPSGAYATNVLRFLLDAV